MMEINVESIASRVPAMIYVYAVNHETGESSFPYVSDYCETMFGFPSSVVMEDPKRLVNCILEDEAEQYAAAVMESMEHLTPFDRLGHMRRADGTIIKVHYKSMPRLVHETNNDGSSSTFTLWDGIVFDITNQVTNEEENTTRIQRMMDESLQPMFEIDIHGCITEWNDTMARITGYSREGVLGGQIVELMPKDEARNFFASAFSGEEQSQCDCIFVAKEDKRLYLHGTCTASNDENGTCKGKIFCCQDVTSLREAEKQKNAALELADAERGLTEWLSHEVRNPLSVAMEAARTLKEGEDDALSCVDLICESIRYIVDLLTNMLDLNKCLDGKIALFPVSCSLREEILVPTCKMMSVSNRHSLVNLELEDGEEVVAEIDKLRLRQVITNIISNALKFTSKGFVRVRLEQHIVGANKRVRISVSDSGCGIKQSDHAALFSKWEQLGSEVNGTGIGLCLSEALVKAMGGRIYLDKDYVSGLDDRPGARFVIDLPHSILRKSGTESVRMPAFESLSAAVVASRAAHDSVTVKPPTNVDLYISVNNSQTLKIVDTSVQGQYKLLIIDDDKMGRKFLKRRFSRLFPQAEIDEVASGEEALIEVEKTNYDIITVDHFMAIDEMSGEETIREMRSRGIDSLIVGISGNEYAAQHRRAGAEDFFQKPIPGDDEIVQRLISKLAPPSSWRVLCVDDAEVNLRFLCRRLHKLASPHFTSLAAAEKRWTITTRTSGEEAVEVLRNEWFDLVVIDYHLGGGRMNGHSVADYVREGSVNKNAIVVLNSGSVQRLQKEDETPYDLLWPKPLPSNEQMRLDLCKELLKSKSGCGPVGSKRP